MYMLCINISHYILNLLFTIIKFHELYQKYENSIVLATVVRKLPLRLICLLKM